MVNVNIEIPDELHRKLKLASVLKGTTIKEYVTNSLATRVTARPRADPKKTKGG